MEITAMTWTGSNVEEMEKFALDNDFGFVVGSNYDNYRWYHRVYDRVQIRLPFLREWEPPDDPTILEVYPLDPARENEERYWTTARPGDVINRDGSVAHAPHPLHGPGY